MLGRSGSILGIVRTQIRAHQANADDKSTYPTCFNLPCSMGLQNYATSSSYYATRILLRYKDWAALMELTPTFLLDINQCEFLTFGGLLGSLQLLLRPGIEPEANALTTTL